MRVLIKLYKSTGRYWWAIIVAALATLGVVGINLITPKMQQNIIAVFEGYNGDKLQRIIDISILLTATFLAKGLLQFTASYTGHFAAWNFVSDSRVRIYNHLQKLSMSFYSDKQTGQLMSRVINDTASFEVLIAHAIPELVSCIILFFGITAILFTMNPLLAALTCIPVPFLLLTTGVFRKIRALHRSAQEHVALLNASLQDNLSGMKEIQIFNKQKSSSAQVERHSRAHAGSLIKALLFNAVLHPAVGFFTSLGSVIVVGVGGYMVLQGDLQVSQLVGFLLYLGQFYAPVSTLARIVEDMQSGIACAERVYELLDLEPEIKDAPGAISLERATGEISFRNVSFSYGNDANILKGITFTAPPNSMIAIVGPSGVGKTTLAALLPRFYNATEGAILLDGINIEQITLTSLRKQISMVLQDVFLFNGTIKDNILLGKPNATSQDMINAAKMARIYDFITDLEDGFDTYIGERGVRLSGGQKQRIALARALLCDSHILILDEATSAVDTETEREIQEAIQNIRGSRTMFVIAHRLSTIKKADCILVMDNGSIVESGSHQQLMEQKGLYYQLYSQ